MPCNPPSTMPLDRTITDPIISTVTENTASSLSRSQPPVEPLPPPPEAILPTELDPLIGSPKVKKPFYRARPLWYAPSPVPIHSCIDPS
jgi:hypothetical protein